MSIMEISKPLVTVIVPAYNHEYYIRDCLCSIVSQTYTNMQVIVIDDGSKDNTENIIREFINENDAKIEFISKENEGLCKTLNRGLNMARGKYVAFLASDDMWLPERIEKQVLFMEKNENIGMIFSDAYFMRDKEASNNKYTEYRPIIRNCFTNSIQSRSIYEALLYENFIPALTVLVRRECFSRVGHFDTSLKYEDYDMWLRISKEYQTAFIDEPLAYYRVHGNNISNNMSIMLMGAMQTLFKQYRSEHFRKKPVKVALAFIKFFVRVAKNKIVKYMNYSG